MSCLRQGSGLEAQLMTGSARATCRLAATRRMLLTFR
jgi:hypothetical protein